MDWFRSSCEDSPVCTIVMGWPAVASRCVSPIWSLERRRICFMDHRPYDPSEREPRIRWELVQRIKKEIAAGTYETPEKLEKALERLLERCEQE